MSLFAEGEPRRNHKTFAVYRSRRRFRRSLRSQRNGGSLVATGGETRAASDSLGNGKHSPPPLFPFSPLARRTIPQATSGAGGISASQGLEGAVTCICDDADASILLHPPHQIPPKIHLFHPTNARLRLSSFFTILQLLYRNL